MLGEITAEGQLIVARTVRTSSSLSPAAWSADRDARHSECRSMAMGRFFESALASACSASGPGVDPSPRPAHRRRSQESADNRPNDMKAWCRAARLPFQCRRAVGRLVDCQSLHSVLGQSQIGGSRLRRSTGSKACRVVSSPKTSESKPVTIAEDSMAQSDGQMWLCAGGDVRLSGS